MDDFAQLSRLSLVSSICRLLSNHDTALGSDPVVAEFLLDLHAQAKGDAGQFSELVKETGAGLPESALQAVDRLVKAQQQDSLATKGKSLDSLPASRPKAHADDDLASLTDEQRKHRAQFPGLAIPDSEHVHSFDQSLHHHAAGSERRKFDDDVEDLMGQLEAVNSGAASTSRKRLADHGSPPASKRPRDDPTTMRGRSGTARPDERPVMYKIYEGTVSNIKDFGAFVALQGLVGRQEGAPLPSHRRGKHDC